MSVSVTVGAQSEEHPALQCVENLPPLKESEAVLTISRF